MKISKHTATDMRAALRLVRDELGPDAVIISTKRLKRGVEVTAAIDFDANAARRLEQDAPASAPATTQPFRPEEFAPPAAPTPQHDPYTIADRFEESYDRVQTNVRVSMMEAAQAQQPAPRAPVAARIPVAQPAPRTLNTEVLAEELAAATGSAIVPGNEMGAELKQLRRMLETQMQQLAWNDLSRRAPMHTQILRELTELGLSQEFASQVVAQVPAGSDLIRARRLAIALISQRLPVTGDRWLDKGGRVALVGPTGVGKTTALAKLAVRWVLRHGPRGIALISADATRLGAHDQIQALGQMLDVPVYTVESYTEIPALLEKLTHCRFVLIDTAGSSQRDTQLAHRLADLAMAGNELETALVLAANAQAGAIEETVKRFAMAKPASCLLTKVDEAASLGGALSVLTRAELPVSYVSEGQRVPEDLRPARALELVSSAVQLAKANGAAADEDLLRRRYGEVAHAFA